MNGCGNSGTIFIAGNYVACDLCSLGRGGKKSLARAFVKEGHGYTHGYLSR